MHWFGVALWRTWGPSSLASVDVYVLAPNAFTAIETAMQAYQIGFVAYAAADLVGGLLHYRARRVRVELDPYVVLEAFSWVALEMERPVSGGSPVDRGCGCVMAGEVGELVGMICYPRWRNE